MVAFFKGIGQTGRSGETIAEKFLSAKGYALICRNYRIPGGEIDLVFESADGLVFVEVKTRRSHTFGPPEEGFTARQKKSLLRSIFSFIQSRHYRGPWRLDLIAITVRSPVKAEIKHFKNILEE